MFCENAFQCANLLNVIGKGALGFLELRLELNYYGGWLRRWVLLLLLLRRLLLCTSCLRGHYRRQRRGIGLEI